VPTLFVAIKPGAETQPVVAGWTSRVLTGSHWSNVTTAKNTGFLIDLGTSSPFDPPGNIAGGSAKSVPMVAKTPGCFKYNFAASNSKATDE